MIEERGKWGEDEFVRWQKLVAVRRSGSTAKINHALPAQKAACRDVPHCVPHRPTESGRLLSGGLEKRSVEQVTAGEQVVS
jgi:hypothetical protein